MVWLRQRPLLPSLMPGRTAPPAIRRTGQPMLEAIFGPTARGDFNGEARPCLLELDGSYFTPTLNLAVGAPRSEGNTASRP